MIEYYLLRAISHMAHPAAIPAQKTMPVLGSVDKCTRLLVKPEAAMMAAQIQSVLV
jgi:chorismate mutase